MKASLVLLSILHLFINAQGYEPTCYKELGCFPTDDPWTSLLRPLPAPKSPDFIQVNLTLFTKSSKNGFSVPLWPKVNLENSDFNANRDKTVFITHGFASSGSTPWIGELKDAYLDKVDANVFAVDWGKGAKSANYLQVASNARIVGAVLARVVKNLTDVYGLNVSNVHLIGHSLGAQISGYCGKRVPNIGRLTGMDPAQPGFDFLDRKVRLASGDAKFMEVIHTSARPITTLGFGIIQPVGDVDFYMNGGRIQPGCLLPPVDSPPKISSITDLVKVPVEILLEWVSCSHERSIQYYISALKANCTMWGRLSNIARQAISSGTTSGVTNSVTSIINTCGPDTCVPLNLETPTYKGRGIFSVTTDQDKPYCTYDPNGDKDILKRIGKTFSRTKTYVSNLGETVSMVSPFGTG